jgi:uncharacterized protein (DUF1330 family)
MTVTLAPGFAEIANCKSLPSHRIARFQIDATTFQIIHAEVTYADLSDTTGYQDFASSIDYTLAEFGGQYYRIPSNVYGRVKKWEGADQLTYTAQYHSCHKFVATSRIIFDPIEETH